MGRTGRAGVSGEREAHMQGLAQTGAEGAG